MRQEGGSGILRRKRAMENIINFIKSIFHKGEVTFSQPNRHQVALFAVMTYVNRGWEKQKKAVSEIVQEEINLKFNNLFFRK